LVTTAHRYGSTASERDLRLALEELLTDLDAPDTDLDSFVQVRKGYYRLRH
jgi:hypothetical protein